MTMRDNDGSGGVAIDFGLGSREQTQGGPSRRNWDNVRPLRKPAAAAPPLS